MSQERLNDADVESLGHQIRRVGMTERVARDAFAEAAALHGPLEVIPNAVMAQSVLSASAYELFSPRW